MAQNTTMRPLHVQHVQVLFEQLYDWNKHIDWYADDPVAPAATGQWHRIVVTHFKTHGILNIKQEHIRLLIPYRCVLSSVNFPPYSFALGSQKVNIYRKI